MTREEQLINALQNYSEAYATPQYSVANFRILNNVTEDEWAKLKETCSKEVVLIQQKYELNLEHRLLDPDIKSSEVTAIKLLMDELKGVDAINDKVTINLNFKDDYEENDI